MDKKKKYFDNCCDESWLALLWLNWDLLIKYFYFKHFITDISYCWLEYVYSLVQYWCFYFTECLCNYKNDLHFSSVTINKALVTTSKIFFP